MIIADALPEYRQTMIMSTPTAPPAREVLAPRRQRLHPYLYAGIAKPDREKILPALVGYKQPLEIKERAYPHGQRLPLQVIRNIVCSATGIKPAAIKSRCRKMEYCRARFMLAYFLRHVNHFSYANIGKCLGGKHHTTIIRAVEVIVHDARTNYQLSRQFVEVQQQIEEELKKRRMNMTK